jgi:hypothetical protein
MNPAPVAIFIYRRPEHVRATLTSLLQCREVDDSPIVVFGDGPRSADQMDDVALARKVAQDLLGTRARYCFGQSNRGLSASITTGVASLLAAHDRVIVIEDDLVFSPNFLEYMNAALDRYAGVERVMHVSGHMFDVPELAGRTEALFLPYTSSWGWGTWRRAWRHYDPAATGWQRLKSDRALRRAFNIGGAIDYSSMLERQMGGVGDSWAIRWYWSVFSAGGLSLFPPRTLVKNTGMDGSGTHGRGWVRRFHAASEPACSTLALPDGIEVDAATYRHVRNALWRQNGRWVGAVTDLLRRWRHSLMSA